MLGLRRLSPVALAALLFGFWCGPLRGESGPDPKAELVLLYTLSVAIDTCAEADLSDSEEEKLDKAISAVEAKLALTEEASEALYTQLSAAADNDKEAFCKEVVPTLKSAIGKLPE